MVISTQEHQGDMKHFNGRFLSQMGFHPHPLHICLLFTLTEHISACTP